MRNARCESAPDERADYHLLKLAALVHGDDGQFMRPHEDVREAVADAALLDEGRVNQIEFRLVGRDPLRHFDSQQSVFAGPPGVEIEEVYRVPARRVVEVVVGRSVDEDGAPLPRPQKAKHHCVGDPVERADAAQSLRPDLAQVHLG